MVMITRRGAAFLLVVNRIALEMTRIPRGRGESGVAHLEALFVFAKQSE